MLQRLQRWTATDLHSVSVVAKIQSREIYPAFQSNA
ncbi:hypothetical protein KP509_29G041900 [Ceratopteris richardii]|uniref:Uncharacterized protein n=1 Tax=Ceratopteris richardii TaxID=49495 RepID=A0A8T2R687_CERRI|nr:hypothetical protein KP509_29G041900 [Ceratopteris richardii]